VLRRVLKGRTSIIVTHDPLDALLLADRVAVLEGGRVVERGRSTEVLSRPRSAYAARLAGLNLVSGTWRQGAVHTDALVVHGLVEGTAPADGDPAVAAFRPQAVALYREEPHGSPRNAFAVTVTDVEPHADLIRVRAGALAADVTVQAAAELELVIGGRVTFVVKATEVSLYGL
jgi:molybdate transport system ATP-binding protein